MISYRIDAPHSSQGATLAELSDPPIWASFNGSDKETAGAGAAAAAATAGATGCKIGVGTGVVERLIGSLSPVTFKNAGVCEREADDANAAPPTAWLWVQ